MEGAYGEETLRPPAGCETEWEAKNEKVEHVNLGMRMTHAENEMLSH